MVVKKVKKKSKLKTRAKTRLAKKATNISKPVKRKSNKNKDSGYLEGKPYFELSEEPKEEYTFIRKPVNVKKIEKHLQKAHIRLAKKNRLLMELNKIKRTREAELEHLRIKQKDLEFLLAARDQELSDKKSGPVIVSDSEVKKLEDSKAELVTKVDDLRQEINKKDAIIELLQKPEYEYKGILTLNIERVKANWIGWSEGANLEEIDFSVVNNGTDSMQDVFVDIHLEDSRGNSYTYKGYKIRAHLAPKERVSKKVHLFKQLKRKGNYKLELKVYKGGHDKEIAQQTKVLVV